MLLEINVYVGIKRKSEMKKIVFNIAFSIILFAGLSRGQNYSLANYSFSGGAIIKSANSDLKISAVIGSAIVGVSESNNIMLRGNTVNSYFLITNKETNVNELKTIPTQFNLYQNYPNPFNPTTIIKYEIPVTGKVVLSVFNLLGQEVSELVNQNQSAGLYEVTLDARNFSSGVYIYQLSSGNHTVSKKLLLLK
jgi:hypothetical protein